MSASLDMQVPNDLSATGDMNQVDLATQMDFTLPTVLCACDDTNLDECILQ